MLLFIFIISKNSNLFYSFFSDDDENNEFTLIDAVLFAWKKRKNRLEHAYAVMAWALSLQPDIRADCMEWLSKENGVLRKTVDEVFWKVIYCHLHAVFPTLKAL